MRVRRVLEIAVTDTHPLVWWLTNQTRRLGRDAHSFFERVESGRAVVCVPATVLVELSEAAHRGAVRFGKPFSAFVESLENTPLRYQVVPLSGAIVARSHTLFGVPERGDRLITATAVELGYPLVTRDSAITSVAGIEHVW